MALFAAGIAVLSIGLVGYLNQDSPVTEEATAADISSQYPISIDDVENLPVAVPYYNPERTVAEPAPEPQVTYPLRMLIESIDVDAPVVEMGMDDQGIPYVPLNGQDVAWYDFSSLPGTGSNAVFAGHINWEGALGVFGRLSEVQPSDTIRLISETGQEYTYEVSATFPVDPDDPASLKVMEPTATDTITLITCGGTWIPDPSEQFGGNYTDRTIVQAKLVESTVAVPVPAAISQG